MNTPVDPKAVVVSPSLYTILHGTDPLAASLVLMLHDVAPLYPPRFRDAHLNADGTEIVIQTRTGGGNRECFCDDESPEMKSWMGWDGLTKNAEGHFPTCYPWMNEQMTKHPLYIRDEDDDFDATYAYFYFRVPESQLEKTKLLATGADPPKMAELTQRALERIRAMTPEQLLSDPQLGPTSRKLKRAFHKISKEGP